MAMLGVTPSVEVAVSAIERDCAQKTNGGRANARVELARYKLTSGERVLYGQRIAEILRITDRPAAGSGRAYVVERAIKRDAYDAIDALLRDYTRQARRLDEIPMVASFEPRVQHVQLARYIVTGGERILLSLIHI